MNEEQRIKTDGHGSKYFSDPLLVFEEWWAVNKVDIGIMPPIMQEAFRELSLKAWNGALKAVDDAV
jgi:hypothetical protein